MTFEKFFQSIRARLPGGERFKHITKSFGLYMKNRDVEFYKHQFILNVKAYFVMSRYSPMMHSLTCDCPPVLYHVTEKLFYPAIMKQGIVNMKTSVVFLSDSNTYISGICALRNEPIILKVDAKRMQEQGYTFFTHEGGVVYLTYNVPAEFIVSEVKLTDIYINH